MAYDRDAERQKLSANMKEKTGKDLEEWAAVARASGISKHGEIIKYLQNEHGLSYGYANSVAGNLAEAAAGNPDGDELLEGLFKGSKAGLRPRYEAIIAAVEAFGDDVQLIPMKQYVSVRRAKQFACIKPATASRIDLGIKLKGVAATDRLEEGGFNGMVSHTVKLESEPEFDAEVQAWLKQAYEAA